MFTKKDILDETIINLSGEDKGLIFDKTLDENTINRLLKWFQYFNCNYNYFMIIYNNIVGELTSLASSCELFKSQTQYEFELSLKFFDLLKSSRISIVNSEDTEISYLLKLSIIFSKYPGMIIKSPEKCIGITFGKTLKKNLCVLTQEILLSLFNQLFVRYEPPHFLVSNLDRLKKNEVAVLMHILQGNNIRSFKGIEIPISRKESFLIMNEIPNNQIKGSNALYKAAVCGKLLNTYEVDNRFIFEFLNESKEFEYRVELFYKRLKFWKQVVRFLSKIKFNTTHLTLTIYIDYFEYMVNFEDGNYNLKGRTIASVTRSILEWHEEQFYCKYEQMEELSWTRTTEKDIEINHSKSLYKFKELTSSYDLFLESKNLKHCARMYARNCYSHDILIFSMQKLIKEQYISEITIEVKDNVIVQLAGKRNRKIKLKELELIKMWINKVGFYLEDDVYSFHVMHENRFI